MRELLERNVEREFGDGEGVGILLSGGVDSSAITALADARRRGSGPVQTFTVTFSQEETFVADEVWGSPDAPYVRDMVAHVGSKHMDVSVSTDELLAAPNRRQTLLAKDVPSPLGNMNTSLLLLYREVGSYVDSVLLGEIADAIFGGFAWLHVPELARATTLPWIAMAHYGGGKHGLGGDLLSPELLATLELNEYCEAAYRSTAAQVEFTEGEDPTQRHMRVNAHLHLTRWLETLLAHDESLGMAHGVEARMPYCDHELVSYVYNVAWSMKSANDQEKSLLRSAVADLLPESVLNRKKSPYPVTQDPNYGRWLIERLNAIAERPGRLDGLINTSAIAELERDPSVLASGPRAWVARANAELLLGMSDWLEEYDINLSL